MSTGFPISDHHHHHMDKENLFHLPSKPTNKQNTELSHRFSQSISLQDPLFNFNVSPEPTSPWSGHPPEPSPLSIKADEDAWNLKTRMSISDGVTGFVTKNNNSGVVGAPWRRSDGEGLFRQQHNCRNRCVAAAWGPPQVQNQPYQGKYLNQGKLVVGGGFSGGCDGGGTAVKRECAGTGVFLPRRYCGNLPETRKRQACPPTNLPARMIQSSTAPPQIQPHIYEIMLMSRRRAMISGVPQRLRSNIHTDDNPEVLLPQEWTY